MCFNAYMTKLLEEAFAQASALPPDRQDEIAAFVLNLLGGGEADLALSPEQVAEIERRLSADEPYVTEEEVRAVLNRIAR